MMILKLKILRNLWRRGLISNEVEAISEEAIVERNCAKLGQSEYKEDLIKSKRNSFVKFKLEDEWKQAQVLSEQTKQPGKYKNWINVHVVGEEERRCANWGKIERWNELPYPESTVPLTGDQELLQEVIHAKQKELENLSTNDVYEAVPFEN